MLIHRAACRRFNPIVITLLLAVATFRAVPGDTEGSSPPLPTNSLSAGPLSAETLPLAIPAVHWPYRGMTYASWTRGDYPWATSWRAQTYVNSQAISRVSITTTNPYTGQGALALAVDLAGGDANRSNGEAYVDLRYHPPLMEPPCCLTIPLNLEGVQVSAQVFCPTGSRGDPSRPNGLQLFAKSVDATGNWWSFYGSWENIREEQWNEVTVTPGTVAPPWGYKDPLFDPTQVVALGIKIGAGGGSTATFQGTCWLDEVCWSVECGEARYGFENVEHALDQLAQVHANAVSLIVTGYMDTPTSTAIYADAQRTHTDQEIVAAIQAIHGRGMRVMLKPHVDVQDGTWRGLLAPVDLDLWFDSYRAFMAHYAQIAEENSVELFCVGTELASLSGSGYRAYWDAVIDAVQAHYSGPLTYAANWGQAPHAEYMNVSFWDRLDLAGIDAYFPLSDKADPSLEELIAGWSNYNGECWTCDIAAWQAAPGKPVLFTEIGYASRDYAAQEPWLGDIGSPNCDLQARAYQAAIEVFADQPWFRGMFWWAWTPFSDAGGCCDRGFTPQNKPAAAVLRDAYYQPALEVAKRADPDPVRAGALLTYTIRVTNTGNVTLTATITDVLPDQVTPDGVRVWTLTIAAPGGVWAETFAVTAGVGYSGTLTNAVQVTTAEGATGACAVTSAVVGYAVYLPVVLKGISQ